MPKHRRINTQIISLYQEVLLSTKMAEMCTLKPLYTHFSKKSLLIIQSFKEILFSQTVIEV